MAVFREIFQHLQEKFFDSVVSNRLVYNTCWEDPRIDRKLLDLKSDSDIVMLTSAGCNALDYLLDNPNSIHCVDANPAQNALLDLKMAIYKNRQYPLLWNMFGKGYENSAPVIFRQQLSRLMSTQSAAFWDKHMNYFSKSTAEGSFYFRGNSGKIAYMIHNRIKHKGVYGSTLNLLDAENSREQNYYFEEVESQLWSAFYKWLIKRNATMALLGVPASQRNMIEEQIDGGLLEFINSALRHIFTELPLQDNYFWRVYLTGVYTRECCPNYLQREYFDFYMNNVQKINLHTCFLNDFLRKNPGVYTHFVLLDHQDWLANSHPDLLAEEWHLLLKNSRPGTKFLFRSAGKNPDFLPEFVNERLTFHAEKTEQLHRRDRVGTYGGTFLAEVKS